MARQKNMVQTTAPVDFEKGRGYGEMGVGLQDNFLSVGNNEQICSTIAMLYLHPNVEGTARANQLSQAMSMLALYAGGAAVQLNKQQFRLLERRVRTYASYMRAPQFDGTFNLAFAKYVLKHAVKRAKKDGLFAKVA
jgi:hypothetical protein